MDMDNRNKFEKYYLKREKLREEEGKDGKDLYLALMDSVLGKGLTWSVIKTVFDLPYCFTIGY